MCVAFSVTDLHFSVNECSSTLEPHVATFYNSNVDLLPIFGGLSRIQTTFTLEIKTN